MWPTFNSSISLKTVGTFVKHKKLFRSENNYRGRADSLKTNSGNISKFIQ